MYAHGSGLKGGGSVVAAPASLSFSGESENKQAVMPIKSTLRVLVI